MSSADRFADQWRDIVQTQCVYCRHRSAGPDQTCTAFPDPARIPDAILTNRADHRGAIEGDHGIRFEPREGVPAADLGRLHRTLDAIAG